MKSCKKTKFEWCCRFLCSEFGLGNLFFSNSPFCCPIQFEFKFMNSAQHFKELQRKNHRSPRVVLKKDYLQPTLHLKIWFKKPTKSTNVRTDQLICFLELSRQNGLIRRLRRREKKASSLGTFFWKWLDFIFCSDRLVHTVRFPDSASGIRSLISELLYTMLRCASEDRIPLFVQKK